MKLIGHTNWVIPGLGVEDDVRDVIVQRAFFRGKDKIELSCKYNDGVYSVSLKRTLGSCFEGQFKGISTGTGISAGTASAKLYSNQDGYLLFGKWIENEWEQIWWVTLKEVDRFPDEVRRKA